MQKLVSQYGQDTFECDDLIPTNELRRWLGTKHVSTTDDAIFMDLRRKIKSLPVEIRDQYTPEIMEQTVSAALWLHRENQLEYRWIMNGYMNG